MSFSSLCLLLERLEVFAKKCNDIEATIAHEKGTLIPN